MRHLGWLTGLVLVVSCSVNPVQNPDGAGPGSGGQAGTTATGAGGQPDASATGAGGQAGTTATGAGGQAGTITTGQGGDRSIGGSGGGGTAGRGGGGNTGSAGHSADAGNSCADIETEYNNALAGAVACTLGATGQCSHLVDTSLSCPGCKRYVNTVTQLDAAQAAWNDQGCGATPHICPQIACVTPGPATCMAGSTTGGGPATPAASCVSAGLSNNSR
jgi:hypothetical protein